VIFAQLIFFLGKRALALLRIPHLPTRIAAATGAAVAITAILHAGTGVVAAARGTVSMGGPVVVGEGDAPPLAPVDPAGLFAIASALLMLDTALDGAAWWLTTGRSVLRRVRSFYFGPAPTLAVRRVPVKVLLATE
jgi:hypothetical protein